MRVVRVCEGVKACMVVGKHRGIVCMNVLERGLC